MAEFKCDHQWSHTAWIVAHVINFSPRCKSPVQPREVNPWVRSRRNQRLSGKSGFRQLREMFL